MSLKPYRSSGAAILFVKSDRCPHCIAAKPEIRSAAASLKGIIPVYAVDEKKNAGVIAKLPGFQGFPTIYFRDAEGRLKMYKGERVGRTIRDWACAQSSMCPR